MLASSLDAGEVERAIQAGACGYLLKDDSAAEIVAAVRTAAAGGSPLSPPVAAALVTQLRGPLQDNGAPELTTRELHVLQLLGAGRRNVEIAEDLAISVYTVKRHVSHLLRKLGAANRTQAAVEATRRGLL